MICSECGREWFDVCQCAVLFPEDSLPIDPLDADDGMDIDPMDEADEWKEEMELLEDMHGDFNG